MNLFLVNHTVNDLLDEIERGNLFSFARYADGELQCLLDRIGNNGNEHLWSSEFNKNMKQCLLAKPKYRIATVQRFINTDHEPYAQARQWIIEHRLEALQWWEAEVFADDVLNSTSRGEVSETLNYVRRHTGPIIIVGPQYLQELTGLFNVTSFVCIPEFNCYERIDEINQLVVEEASKFNKPLILISASMAAEVIIHECYKKLHDQAWLVDVGSIWNPYLGKSNRSYWDRIQGKIVI